MFVTYFTVTYSIHNNVKCLCAFENGAADIELST